ncbi:MAG: DUF4351 domain-containing protein, partial [Acidobacteria bacterium]|nr:DUF4351 domain-containing protein [Acidobacteriota bacterium]
LNVREADEAPAIGRQLALWTGEAKDTLMVTIAQKWFEDGREKGREQGRDEGARELLFRLLRRKFGELPAPATERVLAADHATLLAWTERVLTAATLDDVFVA